MSFWWLNPGHALHGVPDPGAVAADGTREADVVAVIAAAIAAGLRARGEQVTVRQDDDLAAVVAAANAAGANRFLSIHANAATTPEAHGAEVFIHPQAAAPTRLWAERIVRRGSERGRYFRHDDTLYRTADFAVLRETVMPAVLVETGFLTNDVERAWLKTDAAAWWTDVILASY